MLEIGIALLPLLVLLASLLLGHYPGYEAILRISERIARGPRTGRATDVSPPRPRRSQAVSGGLLIAWGLAQRPPPLAPLPS
jgi:hypothetical protein